MAAGSACPSCHHLFDPIGFAFEHFDEAGKFRADEAGLPIDSSGTIEVDGAVSFAGADELATKLAGLDKVGECASGYVSVFAYANGVSCVAETRRAEFVAGTIGFVDYIASLATEPSFRRRK